MPPREQKALIHYKTTTLGAVAGGAGEGVGGGSSWLCNPSLTAAHPPAPGPLPACNTRIILITDADIRQRLDGAGSAGQHALTQTGMVWARPKAMRHNVPD